jgi:acylphosphatase
VSAGGPVRRRVVVHGRVQGVVFRDATRREAARRGVAGWVTNRSDGAVEAVFEGDAESVRRNPAVIEAYLGSSAAHA